MPMLIRIAVSVSEIIFVAIIRSSCYIVVFLFCTAAISSLASVARRAHFGAAILDTVMGYRMSVVGRFSIIVIVVLVGCLLSVIAMGKRKAPLTAEERQDVRSELLARSRSTKVGVALTL